MFIEDVGDLKDCLDCFFEENGLTPTPNIDDKEEDIWITFGCGIELLLWCEPDLYNIGCIYGDKATMFSYEENKFCDELKDYLHSLKVM